MPTTSSAQLATEAWQRIRTITNDPEVADAEHVLMHEVGITGGPMRALRHLPLDDPMPMRELAGLMKCDYSYVTSLVDALEKRELARREAHATDRRIKVIVLTGRGREVAERVQREYATPPSCFAELGVTELRRLCEILRKLGD